MNISKKIVLFQIFNLCFKILSFWFKIYIGQPTILMFQVSWITLLQSSCWDHMCINLNWQENLCGEVSKSRRSGKWSDLWFIRVETLSELHKSSQELLHITLSSLPSVFLWASWPLDHVNCTPSDGNYCYRTNQKNSFMGALAGVVAPLCSCEPKIALKSPIEHQGRFNCVWRFCKVFQRCLLVIWLVEAYIAEIQTVWLLMTKVKVTCWLFEDIMMWFRWVEQKHHRFGMLFCQYELVPLDWSACQCQLLLQWRPVVLADVS